MNKSNKIRAAKTGFFVNPVVEQNYQVLEGQSDTNIIVSGLNWRSKLSRITPRVAEYMLSKGTNLFRRRL